MMGASFLWRTTMFARSSLRVCLLGSLFLILIGAKHPTVQAPAQTHAQLTPATVAPLALRAHNGAYAVDVQGHARPNDFVMLTMKAKLSIDLPIVTLNHFSVATDAGGNFTTTLPIAADFTPTTLVIVEASDAQGPLGTATFVVGAPTAGPWIPLTDDPDYH
jgi:hypothetical protein